MNPALENAPAAGEAGWKGAARASVASELARAAGNAAGLPLRTLAQLARSGSVRRALARDLQQVSPIEDAPPPRELPDRPLRLFVASAEASGERHALRLVEALRAELARAGAPAPELLALGGERTRGLGVETVGDPLGRAAMGLDPLRSLPYYARLLADTGEAIARFRPDLLVPVDSPALFVPLARIARRTGVHAVHFVAPQYWAWAPWRVDAYRAAISRVLTILPFEPSWFARHGVRTAHVGHPALDGLAPAPPPTDPARKALVLLPGSRSTVVARNLPWMLSIARELHRREPALEIVIPHSDRERLAEIEGLVAAAGAADCVEIVSGDLHGVLGRARAALSVSGTVLIDLLHHRLPAAVVYRVAGLASRAAPHLLTVPWFSSVNLLAAAQPGGAPLYWEACFSGEGPRAECLAHLERALHDETFRTAQFAGLAAAAERLGPPGACARAARHVLQAATSTATSSTATTSTATTSTAVSSSGQERGGADRG